MTYRVEQENARNQSLCSIMKGNIRVAEYARKMDHTYSWSLYLHEWIDPEEILQFVETANGVADKPLLIETLLDWA